MIKFVASALVAFAAVPAIAAPAPTANTSFSRDGQTYFVSDTNKGRYRLLRGHDDHGREFNLRVDGNRVTGLFDGRSVDFAMPAASNEVASR